MQMIAVQSIDMTILDLKEATAYYWQLGNSYLDMATHLEVVSKRLAKPSRDNMN